MAKNIKTYGLFIVVLSLTPVVRDLIGLLFATTPGPVQHDIFWHTSVEVLFLLVLTTLLALSHSAITRKKEEEIKLTQTVSIEALASLAEFRDEETASHLRRMRSYVGILVSAIDRHHPYFHLISDKNEYIDDISGASMLHDIGKIAISDTVLLKPGPLTPEEFDQVKRHTVLGAEVLGHADKRFMRQFGKSSYLKLAQVIARSHHEKWDGTGYPDGLREQEIPLSARIVAICDVYDAVTSDRVYKKAWPHEKAIAMIRENRGKHFDPLVTDLLLKNEERFRAIRELNGAEIRTPLAERQSASNIPLRQL